jgi:hypothetical protein
LSNTINKTLILKKYLILIAGLSFFTAVSAQKIVKTSELGIFIGCSYYIGDLNPTGHFGPMTQPAGGVLYRYNYNHRFSFKGCLLLGNIQGDDARSNSPSQQERNLSFKSYIHELSAEAEFNFMEYKTGSAKFPFTPYIFGGIAGYMFNPEAELGNQWIDLQPLGTEGEGTKGGPKKYRLTQISIPFGIGMKFSMARRICLGVEWGMRKTFTPYLDDVSGTYASPAALAQNGSLAAVMADRSISTDPPASRVGSERGNGGRNDWYSFAGATISFEFKPREKPCYSYY